MKFLTALKTALGLAPGCEEVNEFLADYVEGTLEEKTMAQFEEHMDMCKCCNHYMDQYRRTIDMTKEAEAVVIPAELAEHTLSFLRENKVFSQDENAP
jgi:predicted anti-sigma-YlaC factor YlaD